MPVVVIEHGSVEMSVVSLLRVPTLGLVRI